MVDDEYDAINFLAYSAVINNGELKEIKNAINGYLTKSMEINASENDIEEIARKIKNAVQ